MGKEKEITVIYLAGYGHSGTTLLDLVFNGHPRIFGAGGLASYRKLDRRRMNRDRAHLDKPCACGVMVSKCPFWNQVFDNVEAEHGLGVFINPIDLLLNRERYVYYNNQPVDIDDYVSRNERLYENIVRVSGKSIIFDSSRIPNRIALLVRSKKLRLVMLHVMRNGEACISSDKKKRPRTFFRPLLGWMRHNLAVEVLKARYSEVPYVFLRYEDFCENPERELERVLRVVGLTYDPEMMRFRSHESHNFSGHLHKQDKTLPEKIVVDTSWHRRIKPIEHALFLALGEWMNRMYARRARRQMQSNQAAWNRDLSGNRTAS
jgi:hypothetical protein